MRPSDEIVEDESNESPGGVVDTSTWRNPGHTSEENRDVYISPKRQGVTTGKEVEGNGEDRTDEEEIQKGIVPERNG